MRCNVACKMPAQPAYGCVEYPAKIRKSICYTTLMCYARAPSLLVLLQGLSQQPQVVSASLLDTRACEGGPGFLPDMRHLAVGCQSTEFPGNALGTG